MLADAHEVDLPAFAQVDDMLTGGSKNLGYLTCGHQMARVHTDSLP